MTLQPAVPDIPVAACVHVTAAVGPAELTCRECGLLMLPVYERALETMGLSRWACFVCWRGVDVTWGPEV